MNNLILPQNKFPLMKEYKKHFPAINENTIFAYDEHIYCNGDLPECLIVHELTHLRQQKELGLEVWVDKYLGDSKFRLDVEIEAYRAQVGSIHNKSKKRFWKDRCAKDLSSELYNNLVSFDEALKLIS